MKNRTRESLPAQSEHWDRASTREDEWIEITDVQPVLIPAALRTKLERASMRQGVPVYDLATMILEKAIDA